MSEQQRALFIRIRGLLLLAVDLIDRECQLGKYAAPVVVKINSGDSIAGIIPDDKLSTV